MDYAFDHKWQRIFVGCGFAFAVVTAVGLEGLWPQPPSFDLSAQQTAQYYADHQARFQIGITLITVGMALLLAWTVQLGLTLRRLPGGSPTVAAVTIACLASTPVLLAFDCAVFAIAAFRPTDTSPDVTRALSDLAWISSELIYPMLAMGMALTGVLLLKTRGAPGAFPAYLGWFCLFDAVVEFGQAPIIFVKTGPFAADGVLSWYAAITTWGLWALALSVAMWRSLGSPVAAQRDAEAGAGATRTMRTA